jgi:hypothetical protein
VRPAADIELSCDPPCSNVKDLTGTSLPFAYVASETHSADAISTCTGRGAAAFDEIALQVNIGTIGWWAVR